MLPSLPHRPIAHSPSALISDDLLVDRAGQHHLDDLDRLLVGDAQAALELRFDAHLGQHGADLRAAAMDDDRIDAGLLMTIVSSSYCCMWGSASDRMRAWSRALMMGASVMKRISR
jgi:hypothetical protein